MSKILQEDNFALLLEDGTSFLLTESGTPKINTLITAFPGTTLPAVFPYSDVAGAGTVSVADGRLILSPGSTSGGYAYVDTTTANLYDLTGSEIYWQASASAQSDLYGGVFNSTGNGGYAFDINRGSPSRLRVDRGGTGNVFDVSYDPVAHRQLKIREASGTIYFETAPIGGVWTTRYSEATNTNASFDPTLVLFYLESDTWDTLTNGPTYVDGVNVALPSTTIRPSADVTDGGWLNEAGNNTNLYASVDDNPTNDTTYIKSPLTASPDAVILALADPGFTPPSEGMTLTIRLKRV